MPLPSTGSGSGTAPLSGMVGPTLSSGGASLNGYLSQSGVDLNVVGTTTDTLVLSNHTTASAQLTEETGSVSAVILSLQGSIDGVLWVDTGKTISAAGITSSQQDVTPYKLLRVIVTTANGAALLARISILAKTI